jgi:CHAD domain-containing protein
MRVTTRRLRAALQAFPMIVPEQTARLSGELRWLGQVLGGARDADVLERYFEQGLEKTPLELVIGPAQARVTAHFAPAHAAARSAVLEALDSPRYWGILGDLDRLLEDPLRTAAASEPAADVLPRAVAHAYRRTAHRMHRASRAPEGAGRDVALHEARKAAKRARYAAEAVEPVFGKQARRFAQRMKAVQSVLGDHQDAVIARQVAREIGTSARTATRWSTSGRPGRPGSGPPGRRRGVGSATRCSATRCSATNGGGWREPHSERPAGTLPALRE